MNLQQHTLIRSLVGAEINELEFIHHIVVELNQTFFVVCHLNGTKRIINALDYITNL